MNKKLYKWITVKMKLHQRVATSTADGLGTTPALITLTGPSATTS